MAFASAIPPPDVGASRRPVSETVDCAATGALPPEAELALRGALTCTTGAGSGAGALGAGADTATAGAFTGSTGTIAFASCTAGTVGTGASREENFTLIPPPLRPLLSERAVAIAGAAAPMISVIANVTERRRIDVRVWSFVFIVTFTPVTSLLRTTARFPPVWRVGGTRPVSDQISNPVVRLSWEDGLPLDP